jgi:hypothetical protein
LEQVDEQLGLRHELARVLGMDVWLTATNEASEIKDKFEVHLRFGPGQGRDSWKQWSSGSNCEGFT